MDINKMIGMVVGVVVGIIILSSCLYPAIHAATNNTNEVITNETSGITFRLDGNDDYMFESAPAYANYKVNGQPAPSSSALNTFIITDKCRCVDNGHYFQLFDETGVRIVNLNVQNKNVVITYDASEKEFVYTVYTDLTNTEVEDTYTYTVENILYYIPGGDYGAINTGGDPDVTYYVNDLSQVIAGGAYTTGDLDTSYFAEGSTVYVGNASYTASATATTADFGYTDAIKGSSYAVTVTDGESSETFTPYTVFVPLKITVHTANDDSLIELFEIIPVLVTIGLIIGLLGAVISRRE